METIIFKNEQEVDDYVYNHSVQRLGSGQEGVCYLLDNGTVLKRLINKYYLDHALQFKDYNNSSFIFARGAGLVEDDVIALFMEYVRGQSLTQHVPVEQSLKELGLHLQKLVEDIKSLSTDGIYVNDFHCGNIIYDNQDFKIIDTLSYSILRSNYEQENIREIMPRIYTVLLDKIMILLRYAIVINGFSTDCNYSFIGKNSYVNLENPQEYFLMLQQMLSECVGEEVTTIDDAVKKLKRKVKLYK